MNLLALLFVFILPLLLILLVERSGQWLHWLADHLESSGWLRVLSAVSHVGIVFAVVIFVLDWPVRQETLKAFKEEREARAWSLIYQSKGSSGDGGRRYALNYLHNEKKANLAGLPLSNAYLVEVELPGANLRRINLSEANLRKANLEKADLGWADLSKANLNKANLEKVNLSRADLSRASLGEANLSEAYLSKANLSKAYLHKAFLGGANLRGANLSEAYLSEAILVEANLYKANLYKANLHKAYLIEVNLEGAILSGVNLSEANLHGVWNLTQAQIDRTFYCEQRIPPELPAELKPPPTRKCKYERPIGE